MEAIEAARVWARRMVDEDEIGAHEVGIFVEAFMAGASFQSAEAAKMLDGVVRARDVGNASEVDHEPSPDCGRSQCVTKAKAGLREFLAGASPVKKPTYPPLWLFSARGHDDSGRVRWVAMKCKSIRELIDGPEPKPQTKRGAK